MARSKVTSDFIVDRLEQWWQEVRLRFLQRQDAGDQPGQRAGEPQPPDASSSSGSWSSPASTACVVQLAYYPPYHSKYNPIERCWGILEMHWNGSLLDSIEAVVGFAGSMTWKGKHPVVSVVETTYAKGVRLKPEEMEALESEVDPPAVAGEVVREDPSQARQATEDIASFWSLSQVDRHHRRGHTARVRAVAGLVNRVLDHQAAA